jgi:hypothetical protein
MPTPASPDLVDTGWNDVLAWLPPNLDEMAKEEFGFRRRGKIQTAADILRIAMAYSVLDFSLRSSATWMATHGLGDISDVAVLGRLRRSQGFLARVLAAVLSMRLHFEPIAAFPYRVRLIDATCISAPGAEGAEWRVHASYDVSRGTVDHIDLTDETGGENLGRSDARAGDLVVADRGYAHASRLIELRQAGAHFLVRIGHSAVPLTDTNGDTFDPLAHARRRRKKAGRPPTTEAADVFAREDVARAHPLRLVVVRKSAEATRRDRVKIGKEASRKGKAATQRTLDAAAFAFLLTSVPAAHADAATLAELYRVRWQVELNFKRWKSIFDLDRLRAEDPDLARAYIYAKLIAACLADTIARSARAFSPWGIPTTPFAVAPGGLA